MNKYENGKIYTIKSKTNPDLIYVGSTIQTLNERMNGHKKQSKEKSRQNYPLYKSINNNWNEWYIELYEEYNCENKEELRKREGEIIRQIGTLNQRIAGRDDRTYEIDNKQKRDTYKKEYREKNYDVLKEKRNLKSKENCDRAKEYYVNNKDNVKKYKKEYREKNRETLKENNKKYYEENKEKLTSKIKCMCGSVFCFNGKARHEKTEKHQEYLKKYSIIENGE